MTITGRLAIVTVISLSIAGLPACGGSSSTTQPSGNSGTNVKKLTAAIAPTPTSQGQVVGAATAFTATNVTGALLTTGTLGIAGTNAGLSLNMNLSNITGPGTYSLAGGANGGTASWSDTTGLFTTIMGSASGSITLTTATTSRITGTFSFVANDIPDGPAQRRVTVSNGVFDITPQ